MTLRRGTQVVAAVLLGCACLSAACSNKSDEVAVAKQAVNTPAHIAVVDQGARPRRVLAAVVRPGSTENVRVELRTRADALQLPPTITVGRTIVGEVSPSRIEFRHVLDQPPELVGFRADLQLDPRGGLSVLGVERPPVEDPLLRQTMSRLTEALGQVHVPLPAEAVGVGARWTANVEIDQAGLRVAQTSEYELVALRGTSATVSSTTRQRLLGTGDGVRRLNAHGAGTHVLDLARLTPTRSEVSMDVALAIGEREVAMRLELSVERVGDSA